MTKKSKCSKAKVKRGMAPPRGDEQSDLNLSWMFSLFALAAWLIKSPRMHFNTRCEEHLLPTRCVGKFGLPAMATN